MSSSSSTRPADSSDDLWFLSTKCGKLIGSCLIFIWGFLTVFYLISLSKPGWLESISKQDMKETAMIYKNMGDKHLQSNKYQDAVNLYRTALKYNEDDPGIIGNLAITYAQMGNYDLAQKSLKYLLKQNPNEPGIVYRNLGDISVQTGKIDEAIKHYKKSAELGPNPIQSNLQLGMIYLQQENWVEAVKSFSIADYQRCDLRTFHDAILIKTRPQYEGESISYQNISALLETDNNDHMKRFDIDIFNRISSRDRNSARTYSNLGLAYRKLGDVKNARTYFEKALGIWPELDQARSNYNQLLAEE